MEKSCVAVIQSGIWAGGDCQRAALPGFEHCWFHANVEEMGAKIVDLTGRLGALAEKDATIRALTEALAYVSTCPVNSRVTNDETGEIEDMQKIVANALRLAGR